MLYTLYELSIYCDDDCEDAVAGAMEALVARDAVGFHPNEGGVDSSGEELSLKGTSHRALEVGEAASLLASLWKTFSPTGVRQLRLRMRGDSARYIADFIFPIPKEFSSCLEMSGEETQADRMLILRPSEDWLQLQWAKGDDDWFIYGDYDSIDSLLDNALSCPGSGDVDWDLEDMIQE